MLLTRLYSTRENLASKTHERAMYRLLAINYIRVAHIYFSLFCKHNLNYTFQRIGSWKTLISVLNQCILCKMY